MKGMRTIAVVGAGVAVLVALFFVFRPGDDDDESARTTTASTTTTGTNTLDTTTTTPTTTRPAGAPGPLVIRITFRGGRVVGGIKRVQIKQGRRAVLVVSADVSDHVHLHGYNRFADVAPGRPARLRFAATAPGRFEAELEDLGIQILDLQVRP